MYKYSFTTTWSEEDQAYIALCPEFPGVSAFGATPEEAIAEVQVALRITIQTYQDEGWSLPEPRRESEYSGKLLVRMPKGLHGRLAQQAESEGVSLNTLVVTLLSEAMGMIAGVTRIERVVTQTLRSWNATFVRVITTLAQVDPAASGTIKMQISQDQGRFLNDSLTASAHATYMNLSNRTPLQ